MPVIVLTMVHPDDFEARSPDELSLRKKDKIELIERDDDFGDGWYLGKHVDNGKTGLFPEGETFVILSCKGRLMPFLKKSLHNNHTKNHPSLCNHNGHSREDRSGHYKQHPYK